MKGESAQAAGSGWGEVKGEWASPVCGGQGPRGLSVLGGEGDPYTRGGCRVCV